MFAHSKVTIVSIIIHIILIEIYVWPHSSVVSKIKYWNNGTSNEKCEKKDSPIDNREFSYDETNERCFKENDHQYFFVNSKMAPNL